MPTINSNPNYDLNKTRYTHRDYESIRQDLISAIPSLTQEWTSREESDPGIVLIKLMSMFGDTLSYNVDKIALELYISSVTQRKNCAKILSLLGYKMHWYRAARVIAHVRLTSSTDEEGNRDRVVMSPFKTTFKAGDITYSVANQGIGSGQIDIFSSTETVPVRLVQGRKGESSFTKSDLVNNRYYLSVSNVDESEFYLTITGGRQVVCTLVDNLYLESSGSKILYEFNVDEYDRPYIQLSDNWEDVAGSTEDSVEFHLLYIITDGVLGNVTDNAFDTVEGLDSGVSSDLIIINLANTTDYGEDGELLESYNSPGYSPQTVNQAKIDSANYVFTLDTLITSSDYEKAAKRVSNITVSKMVDAQVVINDQLNLQELVHRALDNCTLLYNDDGEMTYIYDDDLIVNVKEPSPTDPDVTEEKSYLAPYRVFLYLAYRNFDSSFNYYYSSAQARETPWSLFDPDHPEVDPYDIDTKQLREAGYYPYRPQSNILQSVRENIDKLKTLNVKLDFGTMKVFPFRVKGILHLVQPLSPQETLQVVEVVDNALRQAYYPDLHPIGEKPNFIEIVDIIQNSDERIKYFDAIDNIVKWAPVIPKDQEKFDAVFDTTSAIMYNGLAPEFNLNKRFLSFKLKNVGAAVDPNDRTIASTEGYVKAGYSTAYLYDYSRTINSDKTITVDRGEVIELQLNDINELKALCTDMRYKGDITMRFKETLVGGVTVKSQTVIVGYTSVEGVVLTPNEKIINLSLTSQDDNRIKSLTFNGEDYTVESNSVSQEVLDSLNNSGAESFSINLESPASANTQYSVSTRRVEYEESHENNPGETYVYKTFSINNTGLQWVGEEL